MYGLQFKFDSLYGHCKVSERLARQLVALYCTTLFFDGLWYHHGAPEASPYNNRDRSLVVLLTFAIFFSFAILYLTAGIVWALAVTALAVALSCYLSACHRAALSRATAVFRMRVAASLGSGSGSDHFDPAESRLLPAFAYKREGSGWGGDAGAESWWAQSVICLGLVQVGELVRRLPACRHMFHVDCIDMWLRSHSTCPICRDVVTELTSACRLNLSPFDCRVHTL